MNCLINGRRYSVSHVFNMVGNYYFHRGDMDYLVDAEDVSVWVEENELTFNNGIQAAIAFAKDVVTEDGDFWWKAKASV